MGRSEARSEARSGPASSIAPVLPSVGWDEGAADNVTGRLDATQAVPPKITTTATAAAAVNNVTGRRHTLTVVADTGSVAAAANSSVLPRADVRDVAGMTSGVVAVGLALAVRGRGIAFVPRLAVPTGGGRATTVTGAAGAIGTVSLRERVRTSGALDATIAGRRGEGRDWSARWRAMGCVSTMGTAAEREATRRAHGTARRLCDWGAIEGSPAGGAAGCRFAGTRRCGTLTGDSATLSTVLASAARARVVPAMVGRTVDVLTSRALTVDARVVDDRRFAEAREREGVKPREAAIRDAAAGCGKSGSPSRPAERRLLSIQSGGIGNF